MTEKVAKKTNIHKRYRSMNSMQLLSLQLKTGHFVNSRVRFTIHQEHIFSPPFWCKYRTVSLFAPASVYLMFLSLLVPLSAAIRVILLAIDAMPWTCCIPSCSPTPPTLTIFVLRVPFLNLPRWTRIAYSTIRVHQVSFWSLMLLHRRILDDQVANFAVIHLDILLKYMLIKLSNRGKILIIVKLIYDGYKTTCVFK